MRGRSTFDRLFSMTSQDAWRRKPIATTANVVVSLVRRKVAAWQRPVISYDEGRARITADLTSSLGLTLFRYGMEDPDIAIVCRLLQKGDLFVDGGANVGLFTLAAASSVGPTGSVIAFEPAKMTCRMLRENVKLNDFSWVDIRQAALSETSDTRTLMVFGGSDAGLSSFSPAADGGRAEQVPTTTLDEALAGRKARVIKLDLEGAEYAALLGAEHVLAARECCFLFELEDAHLRRQGASIEMVTTLLDHARYQLFSVGKAANGEPVAARGIVRREGATPNVLAAPDERIFEQARVGLVDAAVLR